MISWNSDHSSLLPIPIKKKIKKIHAGGKVRAVRFHRRRPSPPMLTFRVSWQTCTSMFLLSRLALFLRFPGRASSKSACGGKPSLMGVTEAEGTDEVGVLDLLPVLLGVAATESDSDPSSFTQSRGVRRWARPERHKLYPTLDTSNDHSRKYRKTKFGAAVASGTGSSTAPLPLPTLLEEDRAAVCPTW